MFVNLITILACVVITTVVVSFLFERKKPKKTEISFKETLMLTDLPLITFTLKGGEKLTFLIDSGSTECLINEYDAQKMKLEMIECDAVAVGTTGKKQCTSHTTSLELLYENATFVQPFVVHNLAALIAALKENTGARIHGLLGTDFLKATSSIIDYEVYKLKFNKWKEL